MTDDLRLRVAFVVADIVWPQTPWNLLGSVSQAKAMRLADAILPLLDNPLIDEDDWNRWHQAREKFLGEEK